MPKRGDLNVCLFCDRLIAYDLYYYSKGRAIEKWAHKEGTMSCLTKPEGWVGEWPRATPTHAPA